MRILLTNDDGINAPGLKALRDIAGQLSDDVWVVAPETDQSGASHSLTLSEPLRLRKLEDRLFAVRGTPTDCVIMGLRHVLKDAQPDLVLSGVNRGANIADDVTYSGTIAGAMEGTILGVRSIALSLAVDYTRRGKVDWASPVKHGPGLIRKLLEVEWGKGVLMNINFPFADADDVLGTHITTQGRRDQSLLQIEERKDTRNNPYYWIGFERRLSNPADRTDLRAVYDGYISVTPLHADLTHFSSIDALAGKIES